MNKKHYGLLAAIFVLTVFAFIKHKRESQEITLNFPAPAEISEPEQPFAPALEAAATAKDSSATQDSNSATKKQEFTKKLRDLKVTNVETAREEIAKNPHVTPPSVVASAIQIAVLYDKISDEEDARQFLEKMRDCSSSDANSPTSVKASCLGFTRRVASRFPTLNEEAAAIRANSSADAVRIENLTSAPK